MHDEFDPEMMLDDEPELDNSPTGEGEDEDELEDDEDEEEESGPDEEEL